MPTAANPSVENDFLLSSFLRKIPAEIRQQIYLHYCQCFPGMLRIAKIPPLEDGEGKLHVHCYWEIGTVNPKWKKEFDHLSYPNLTQDKTKFWARCLLDEQMVGKLLALPLTCKQL